MRDNSWKLIGNQDPYFGVLTHEQFHLNQMNKEKIDLFFQTGNDHVSHVINKLKLHFNLPDDYLFTNALDFGCGTGRLIIPFAKKCLKVTGVDISEGMLKKAALHIEEQRISNISLLQIDDFVSYRFEEQFDLVHTFIVLQHINENFGYDIIKKLLSILQPGGYGIIHVTFDVQLSKDARFFTRLKRKFTLVNKLFNLLKGRPVNRPFIQMNDYDLNRTLRIFYNAGIHNLNIEFTNHDGCLGIIILFKNN